MTKTFFCCFVTVVVLECMLIFLGHQCKEYWVCLLEMSYCLTSIDMNNMYVSEDVRSVS